MSRLGLTLKLLILQCALRGGLFVGSLIARAKGEQKLSIEHLTHIIINRSDRIGDAVLSVPLLEVFIDELRVKGYQHQITILSSQLNDFVLRPLERYNGVMVEISPVVLPEYVSGVSSLLKKIKNRVFSLLFFRPTDPLDTQTLLLDFMANGDAAVPLHYKQHGNPMIYGLNALTSTILYDRSLPRALVHRSDYNLIETYLELITGSIAEMDGLRERALREFSTRFYPSIESVYPELFAPDFDVIHHGLSECLEWSRYYESLSSREQIHLEQRITQIHKKTLKTSKQAKSLLIFVGAYSHRSLPIETWCQLIIELSGALIDYDITLMDGPENTILPQIRTHLGDDMSNVSYYDTIIPLKLFALVASKYSHVIGLDGGGINFVRRFTHSLSIFTFANPLVWRAYPGTQAEQNIDGSNAWYLRYFVQKTQSIAHMAKKHFLLPTFNISEAKIFINDLDPRLILEWIQTTQK